MPFTLIQRGSYQATWRKGRKTTFDYVVRIDSTGKIYFEPDPNIVGYRYDFGDYLYVATAKISMTGDRQGTITNKEGEALKSQFTANGIDVGTLINKRNVHYPERGFIAGVIIDYTDPNNEDDHFAMAVYIGAGLNRIDVLKVERIDDNTGIWTEIANYANILISTNSSTLRNIGAPPADKEPSMIESVDDPEAEIIEDVVIRTTLKAPELTLLPDSKISLSIEEIPEDDIYKDRKIILRRIDGNPNLVWDEIIITDLSHDKNTVNFFYGDLKVGTYQIMQYALDSENNPHKSISIIWHLGSPEISSPIDYTDVTGTEINEGELEFGILDRTKIDGFSILFGHPELGESVF